MASLEMKRLELAAVRSQRDAILGELASVGVRKLEDAPRNTGFARESAGAAEYRTQLETVLRALAVLDEHAPKKTPLFARRSKAEQGTSPSDAVFEEILGLARALCDKSAEICHMEAEQSRLEFDVERLKPWENMDASLGLTQTRTCSVLTGMLPVSTDIGELESALDAGITHATVQEISADGYVRYVAVIAMTDKCQETKTLLQTYGFAPSSLSGLDGTAKENLQRLKEQLSALGRERGKLANWIFSKSGYREDLNACANLLKSKIELATLAESAQYSRHSFIFSGWIPTVAEKELGKRLSSYDCAWEVQGTRGSENPSQIRRKGFFGRKS